MRDYVKPEEYAVIKATLPLVVELKCHGPGAWFSHFWQLPPEVRTAINQYQIDDPQTYVFRFEIYRGDRGEGNLLVFGFSSDDIVGADIHCLGEYLPLVKKFVVRRDPVGMQMLQKLEAMTHERWSWRSLLKSKDPNDAGLLAGLVVTGIVLGVWLWSGFQTVDLPSSGLPLKELLLEYFMAAFFFLIGPGLLALAIRQNWQNFHKQRSKWKEVLRRYEGSLGQAIPVD